LVERGKGREWVKDDQQLGRSRITEVPLGAKQEGPSCGTIKRGQKNKLIQEREQGKQKGKEGSGKTKRII